MHIGANGSVTGSSCVTTSPGLIYMLEALEKARSIEFS